LNNLLNKINSIFYDNNSLLFKIILTSFLLNTLNLNGDWGLGIGDWAQSPIPNPQSPINYLMFNV